MKFTKMHGLGNDYVYVNGFSQEVANPAEVARKVADRHFGIGSDGLILILPSQKADVRMRMFNADGSEGEMCGNGIRCVAKYAFDHGLTKNNPMRVETARGVLTLDLVTNNGKVELVTVNMGQPHLELERVPVDGGKVIKTGHRHEYKMSAGQGGAQGNELVTATFVNIGNPHGVIFVEDVAKVELEQIGGSFERHPAFPKRANVHWVQVISKTEARMRTWERGSGITMACGTGASAVLVAGVVTGRLEHKALIHLPGGDLTIEWREADDCVYMTGPATEVFSGEWEG